MGAKVTVEDWLSALEPKLVEEGMRRYGYELLQDEIEAVVRAIRPVLAAHIMKVQYLENQEPPDGPLFRLISPDSEPS